MSTMRKTLALVVLLSSPLAAQSVGVRIIPGPVPGVAHAPLLRLSLGMMSYADTSATWTVAAGPVALGVAAYQQDSASMTPAPPLVWTSIRTSIATLSAVGAFACRKRGDARIRVRWVTSSGTTIAADSTVILCR